MPEPKHQLGFWPSKYLLRYDKHRLTLQTAMIELERIASSTEIDAEQIHSTLLTHKPCAIAYCAP